MIPVLTPAEMAEVDHQAADPTPVLVARAGRAVAQAALTVLGGSYGRRVVVIAGPGNNGNDGRAAATRLKAQGVRAAVLDARDLDPHAPLPPADLIIDAAYGTGLARPYVPPRAPVAPVLAVDIPSGLSGLTGLPLREQVEPPEPAEGEAPSGPGQAHEVGDAVSAVATVTFAALKPGLLLGEGPQRSGDVGLADIGLDAQVAMAARAWLVTDHDVSNGLPVRPRETHKWRTALGVVAGSPGMTGAPWLASRAAMRGGAGYVLLGTPGAEPGSLPPSEVVGVALPQTGWAPDALERMERCRALVVGPGLGHIDGSPGGDLWTFLERSPLPAVLDADGLNAFPDVSSLAALCSARQGTTVITPHDGEFARLVGAPPGADRLAEVRSLSARTGAVVLLKGSTTVVADPEGEVRFCTTGSPRLATAGTGDVLSGLIGAFLARGVDALEAASLATHTHGRAAGLGRAEGLVASDLPDLISTWLSELS